MMTRLALSMITIIIALVPYVAAIGDDKVSCCSDAPCKGRCMKGYCPYLYSELSSRKCRCPPGLKCCRKTIIPPTPCEKCNNDYKCVPNHVSCASPVSSRTCTCPKGKKCCKGPFCFECGGRCMKGSCAYPFYQLTNSRCPCPRGMSCCIEARCESRCRNSRCVPANSFCLKQVYDTKCTCPPNYKCCQHSILRQYCCSDEPCFGTCVKGYCPYPLAELSSHMCRCPPGLKCCRKTISKCPNTITTPSRCRQLEGWAIPAIGLPAGQVCCKAPTCEGLCEKYNALCVPLATCRHRLTKGGKCWGTCAPGKVCCEFKCGFSSDCKGGCYRGKCPSHLRPAKATCNCPHGRTCCQGTCAIRCKGKCMFGKSCSAYHMKEVPRSICTCQRGDFCCIAAHLYTKTTTTTTITTTTPTSTPPINGTCAIRCDGKCMRGNVATCGFHGMNKTPSTRCTCQPGFVCCKPTGTCEIRCKGECMMGKSCSAYHMKKTPRSICTCPGSRFCCIGAHVSPPTTTTTTTTTTTPTSTPPINGTCEKRCDGICTRGKSSICGVHNMNKTPSTRCTCQQGFVCCKPTGSQRTTTTNTETTSTTFVPTTPTHAHTTTGQPPTTAPSNKCPGNYKLENGRYVLRTTCSIFECDPATGARSGLTCPLYQPPRLDMCKRVALKKEGCYEGWVTDNTKVYPKCCPEWKKICKGDPGFDASKVPKTVAPDGMC